MTYEDQFKKPSHYYKKINRLVDEYRDRGFVNLVYDWEQRMRNVADMPDLKLLAINADDIYNSLQGGIHK